MSNLEFELRDRALRIYDRTNKGSLVITSKYRGNAEISPLLEAWNDIETDIAFGKLKLSLYGYNTIKERKGFILDGDVWLSSSHLYDPTIINSRLHLVSLKAKSYIKDSELMCIGNSSFGTVQFTECKFNSLPKRVPDRHTSYYRNEIIGMNHHVEHC